MRNRRITSSNPGDFDQQHDSGQVHSAFEGLGLSWESAWPDQDWPQASYGTGKQSESDFNGYSGHEGDFGYSSLKLPKRVGMGEYRNPFAWQLQSKLPPAGSKPYQPMALSGEFTDALKNIKTLALIGFAVFAYYKFVKHKEELKSAVNQSADIATKMITAMKSNPMQRKKRFKRHRFYE